MRRSRSPRRRLVESSWILDADQIPRPIRADASGELELTTRDGTDPIVLWYLIRNIGLMQFDAWLAGTPASQSMRFRLEFSRLWFGGARTYFACPGCERRSLKLYLPFVPTYGFACRDCHRLAYRSSSQRRRSVAEWRAIAAQSRAAAERPLPPLPSPEAEWRRPERSLARTARRAERS